MSDDTIMLPRDWRDPDWSDKGRIHNWKRYTSPELRGLWPTFTDAQARAVCRVLIQSADSEDWD